MAKKVPEPPPAASCWKAPAIVFVVALLVPLLNAIPTLDGYLEAAPPDRVFLGFRYMAGDHYQYASFVQQAADDGRFFMDDRFTTEPQRGSFVLLYLWLVGMLCRYSGMGVVAAWELMRVVAGFGFLWTVWRFTALLFRERASRLLAYVFVAFAGGIGWVGGLAGGLPVLSHYHLLRDPFSFQWNWSTFGAMLVPLWIAPAALAVLGAIVIAREKPLPAGARWAAGLLLPLATWFMHPYTGNLVYLAFGLYAIAPAGRSLWRLEGIDWKGVGSNLRDTFPSLASFAVVAVYLLWARQDSVFALANAELLKWNPAYSVFMYPVTYGLLLPLAVLGLRWSAPIDRRPRQILLSFLAASLILATNPIVAGVKYQYFMHVPIAILASHGLIELRRRSERAAALTRGLPAVLMGALLFATPPLALLRDMQRTAQDRDIYLTQAEIDAMRFLRGQPAGAVLCALRAGGRIPWLAGRKAYTGHWLLTPDSAVKDRETAIFFGDSVTASQKRAFLNQNGLRYVFYGPDEARYGKIDPAIGLTLVYDRGGVKIYQAP